MVVPYFRPDLGDEEIELVTQVMRSGWLTTGPMVKQFEREFAARVGARHAIAVSSCTGGLHAALVSAGIGAGAEVITTPMTFCGTIQAIEEAGAKPVFVDIAKDLNLDCSLLPNAVTERTSAILPVHVGGLPCDMDALRRVSERYTLSVVEDAAHAFGASCQGQEIGSSDFSTAVFSFYANKNLTTAEGGMVTTPDEESALRIRRFSSHGIRRDSDSNTGWQYEVTERGFKYNLPDVLAAIGVAQLHRAESNALRRTDIARFYREAFRNIEAFEIPSEPRFSRHAWHLYIMRINLDQVDVERDEFVQRLSRRGVCCSVHFKPIPMHSWFAHYGSMDNLPKAKAEYPRLISLPIYPSLSDGEREFVASSVLATLQDCRRKIFAHRSATGC